MEPLEVHILAGGKSSRMGEDKGLMEFKGIPMVRHVIDTALTLNFPVKIITNNFAYKKFELPIINDNFRSIGPIGGIEAGLENSMTENVLFLPCDTPFISASILDELISTHASNTVTICRDKNGFHPLIGVYSKKMLPIIKEQIAAGNYKITDSLDKFAMRAINFEGSAYAFKNINTPHDL